VALFLTAMSRAVILADAFTEPAVMPRTDCLQTLQKNSVSLVVLQ